MIRVVLPAFNESEALPRLLASFAELGQAHRELELSFIVVDDGSRDGTAESARAASPGLRLELLAHETNQGLGFTLRDGLAAALSEAGDDDVIVTMDADDTHPVELIPAMVEALGHGADVVIASRFRPGARVVGVSPARRFLSGAAALLIALVFPTRGVRDFTCGFRAYRKGALARARDRFGTGFIAATGFQVQCDILLKLRALSPPVHFAEVPLVLRYDRKPGASKMKVARTAFATVLLLVRRRAGVYR
ncbi:MAG: glycosyltransferase [Acidobacteriia bacterium]|nr:glycosyltransferase [Terriglobia bacterium]